MPTSLRSYRRYWALFFLSLFLFLLWVADYGRMQGWQIALFLELDPLTALAAFLTSGTLYKGLALALCIIVPTLFLGRFFCSWVCPLGITGQILGRLFNRRKPADEQHLNAYRPVFRIKYYLLVALLVLAALGSLQIGLLDPIALIYRSFTVGVLPGLDRIGLPVHLQAPVFQGGVLVALLFAAILVANRFMPRFWCRVLCPLGALLGVLSRRAPLRIQRDVDKCTDCGKCVRHCQGACDPDRELRIAECHLCMNCIEDCPEDALHFGLRRARSSAHRPIDISRRRLVETAVTTAVLLPMVRSSASGRTLPTAAVIRPPGSLDRGGVPRTLHQVRGLHAGLPDQRAAAGAARGGAGGAVDTCAGQPHRLVRAILRGLRPGLSHRRDPPHQCRREDRQASPRAADPAGHRLLRLRPLPALGHAHPLHRLRGDVPDLAEGDLVPGRAGRGA